MQGGQFRLLNVVKLSNKFHAGNYLLHIPNWASDRLYSTFRLQGNEGGQINRITEHKEGWYLYNQSQGHGKEQGLGKNLEAEAQNFWGGEEETEAAALDLLCLLLAQFGEFGNSFNPETWQQPLILAPGTIKCPTFVQILQ